MKESILEFWPEELRGKWHYYSFLGQKCWVRELFKLHRITQLLSILSLSFYFLEVIWGFYFQGFIIYNLKTFELSLLYKNREAAVWFLGCNKIHTIQSGLKMKGSRRALFQLLIYLAWWQRIKWEGKDFPKVSHKWWGKYLEREGFFVLWKQQI